MNPRGVTRVPDLIASHVLDARPAGSTWRERGYFAGCVECLEALVELCGGPTSAGSAFGGIWPYVEADGHIVAPAMPCPVATDEVMAVDGAYRRVGSVIERESAGATAPFLALEPPVEDNEPHFDLIWFSDTERFVLSRGTLGISGLFARFEVRPTADDLRRMLGERRAEAKGLGVGDRSSPASVRSARLLRLIRSDAWRDPLAYFSNRPDLSSAKRDGSHVMAVDASGAELVFGFEERCGGWTAKLVNGRSLYSEITLREDGDVLWIEARVEPELEVAAAETRARLAFDLNGDLRGF